MKKIIALAICLAMLLACAAAAAEAETKSMGVLKVNGAFDITYSPLPDDYTLQDIPATDKKDLLEHYNDWVTDPDLTEETVRKYLKRDTTSG